MMMMMIIIINLPWGVKNWSSKNIIIKPDVRHHQSQTSRGRTQTPHLNIRDI